MSKPNLFDVCFGHQALECMCLKFIHLLSNEGLINIKDVNVGMYKECAKSYLDIEVFFKDNGIC